MRLNFLLFADYAAILADNKFLIAGEFDRIYGAEAPLIHPSMFVVGRLETDAPDANAHALVLVLVDRDGAVLRELQLGNVTFAQTPFPNTGRVAFMLRIDNLNLPNFGAYSFQVRVDGDQAGSARFAVERITPQQAAAHNVQIHEAPQAG